MQKQIHFTFCFALKTLFLEKVEIFGNDPIVKIVKEYKYQGLFQAPYWNYSYWLRAQIKRNRMQKMPKGIHEGSSFNDIQGFHA